jgi:hypothetical protein
MDLRSGGQDMKTLLYRALTLAGLTLLAAPAGAEVRHIEIHIAGYLCGA